MAGLGNNLYPPIFKKAYMPAFNKDSQCKIYFSLSVYNSLSDFANLTNSQQDDSRADMVQVSVQNQNTNYSALNLDKYPSGIMHTNMYEDTTKNTEDKYYIILEANDLAEGNQFNPGEFYKVQIRFTSNQVEIPTGYTNSEEPIEESWYNNNLQYFSEWSQTVLIKGITPPIIKLNDFSKEMDQQSFKLQDIYVTGKIIFPQPKDNEYLKKYRIRIYNKNSKKCIEDSKEIYANQYQSSNDINYKIKYNFNEKDNEEQYILKIYIQTNNLYENELEYPFQVDLVQFTTLDSNLTIIAYQDKEGGCIKINVFSSENTKILGTNYIIRRCSSKDNFEYWEDMHIFLAKINQTVNYDWFDRTVQSGVWYKYSIQQRNFQGFRSNSLQIAKPVMVIFDDIFLIDEKQQLKVKFDPQVNNYSHVISESLTQTIGSKYPFIRRNGNTDYRSFTLTGTISHFIDARENGMGASQVNLYRESLENYKEYNKNHGINIYNNSVYERDFRQKVIEFLYRNTVKLYKSTTQGSILVKLMNITFTPNNTLSRHIYGFSCTVQQIDDFSILNCDKYNIQKIGEYVHENNITLSKHGQISVPNLSRYNTSQRNCIQEFNTSELNRNWEETYINRDMYGIKSEMTFKGGQKEEIITNYVLPKYKKIYENDKIKINIDHLSYLKIEFTSAPYLILPLKNGGYKRKEINDKEENCLLGHVIFINRIPIIVGPEGIYELTQMDTQVKSLSFLETETAFISYEAVIIQSEKEENIPKMYGNFKRIGQLYGYFNSSESIYKKIYNKYYQTFRDTSGESVYSQKMQTLLGIRLYAKPNTVFYIRQQQDSDYDEFIMNESGLLEFYDDNTSITGIYLIGPKLKQIENTGKEPQSNEYVIDNNEYEDYALISKPKNNHVYKITNSNSLTVLRSQLYNVDQVNMAGIVFEEGREMAVIDRMTILLNKNFTESQHCIFHNGSWFLFSLDTGIILGYPNEVIVDYYCQILRERY